MLLAALGRLLWRGLCFAPPDALSPPPLCPCNGRIIPDDMSSLSPAVLANGGGAFGASTAPDSDPLFKKLS